jgi:hypothetical protein
VALLLSFADAVVAFALQLFKGYGEKWLDAGFDERLQNFRHAQAQEIEGLRFKVSTLLNRATKLHQREFEVLPEAWARLSDAFWKGNALVAFLKQQANLNDMSEPQRKAVIKHSRLQDWQKNEVRAASDARGTEHRRPAPEVNFQKIADGSLSIDAQKRICGEATQWSL